MVRELDLLLVQVRVSLLAGIVGGGSECPLFHLQYHDWGETLEQGTEPPTALAAHCSGCVFTVCVFTIVCVCVCVCTWMG